MFLSRSTVKSFISFGKFHRRMISGFIASTFSFTFRNTSDSDCPERLLRPRPIKLSPPRISSTVAPLSIVLRLTASVSCCGLSPRRMKNRLLRSCLFRYFQAVLFIARWSEETTITVSLNHGDALILLINSAMFSWLQLTALKDWLGLPS